MNTKIALVCTLVALAGCAGGPSDSTEESLARPAGVSMPLPHPARKQILWSKSDGSAGRWHYVGPSTTMNTFNWGGAGWDLVAQGNFFGDGQQSLLWRRQAGSDYAFWRMNGDSAVATTLAAVSLPCASTWATVSRAARAAPAKSSWRAST